MLVAPCALYIILQDSNSKIFFSFLWLQNFSQRASRRYEGFYLEMAVTGKEKFPM